MFYLFVCLCAFCAFLCFCVHYVFWCVLCVWAKLPEIKLDDDDDDDDDRQNRKTSHCHMKTSHQYSDFILLILTGLTLLNGFPFLV